MTTWQEGLTILDQVIGARRQRPGDDTRAAMAVRQQCASEGHRYAVHGKTAPTKVSCKRCGVSWAIGARTEPTP